MFLSIRGTQVEAEITGNFVRSIVSTKYPDPSNSSSTLFRVKNLKWVLSKSPKSMYSNLPCNRAKRIAP